MEQKPLSLSKKLDGGYLHVKKHKGDSNKSKHSPSKGGYSNYLHRNKHEMDGNTYQKGGTTYQKGGTTSMDKQKVVSIQLHGGSKKRRPSPKKQKKQKQVKDISESTILPKKKDKDKPKGDAVAKPKEEIQAKPEEEVQAKPKGDAVKPKGIHVQLPKTKGSLKKRKVTRRSLSKKRGIKKSLTKRRTHDLKKGKRISVTKTRKYSKKDISFIQNKLKNIKGKSTDDIQKELKNQGVELSGKSPEILKDIYMYSQLCGINIKRE